MKHILFFIAAASILLSCGNNPGGTSDETIIRASAFIYESDGITPAKGATVRVFVSSAADGKYSARQTTDANGKYSINGLVKGNYNIWAQKDSFVSVQNSVSLSDSTRALKNDTLRCPSTLTGIVGVQPTDNPNSVTGRLIGSDKRFTPDPSGWFTIKGLAAGTFSLLLTSSLAGYSPTTIAIFVHPCSHDTLKDTIRAIYSDFPGLAGP
jgi:hypothetical protein